MVACNEKNIPSKEEVSGEESPLKIEDPTDKPYEYEEDLDYDLEAFVSGYTGTPYPETHRIPGTLEAEDFDDGELNEVFYESDEKVADKQYRGNHSIDVRLEQKASGGYYIGDVQPGEWMCYTLEVLEAGSYSVDVYCVKGDGTEGSFYFEIDGKIASRNVDMPLGDWIDFTQKATVESIQLTKGKHILKYFGNTPGNIDKFVFTRVGEYEESSNKLEYPMTQSMSNPLFVEFGSPMYNSWLVGNLYTADPSARVWNIDGKEVLYVYASHDMEPALGCDRMDRYHVFSTEDMVNWTDHGEIMNAATVKLHDGWGCEGFMWAPDCVYNPSNQRYYFYFPHPTDANNWNSTWRVGVAVSRYPDKEFWVVGYVEGMPAEIDPCVFVDDDGQPYIYNGGGGKCYGGKLRKDDWTKLEGQMEPMTGLVDFHEGVWVHKKGGVYYMSYADNYTENGNGANRLRYAVSDSPLGPWKYQGVYLGPTGCDTSHGSIVKFKGEWYAFYHNCAVSGQGNLRSVCVDKLYYNADGTIQMVKQTK